MLGDSTSPSSVAILLAFSSSTDNFAVGLSVALSGSRLPPRVNLLVSLANAIGALCSAVFGTALGETAPTLAPMAAAAIFLYLAHEELSSWRQGDRSSPLARSASEGLVGKLALPMTLNNLAGGIAGGVVGVAPIAAGGSVFVASYLMMAGGHMLGRRLGECVERYLDPRLLAAAIFLIVAIVQAADAWAALPSSPGTPSR